MRRISKQKGRLLATLHPPESVSFILLPDKHVLSQQCAEGGRDTVNQRHLPLSSTISLFCFFFLHTHSSLHGGHVTDLKRRAFAFLFPGVSQTHMLNHVAVSVNTQVSLWMCVRARFCMESEPFLCICMSGFLSLPEQSVCICILACVVYC